MQDKNDMPHWQLNAAFFIVGQFLSLFGSMIVSHAVTWHITLTLQSGVMMALFTCAVMLPMVFVSPFAGVWADRYNCKYLINIADAAIALITLMVALFYKEGSQGILLLLVGAMARSMGQGVQSPAVSALIPQIVPEEHLQRFNGINGAVQSVTMFAAPFAANALINYFPLQQIFYIDVATAAFGIATVFFCVKVTARTKRAAVTKGAKAYYTEIMAGLRFIGSQPWLKTMFVATALFAVLVTPAATLTPLQVARKFGDDPWRLLWVEIAFSAGMMGGGVFIAVWGGFKNKVHTMILAWFLFGVSTVLFGVIPNFWVYIGVMAFCGLTMPIYNTPSLTLMQLKIPPELMGRVFSVLMIVNGLAMPVSIAFMGPLGDVVSIDLLLVVTGVLMMLGVLVLYGRKELIEAGAPKRDAC